jgi:hypothetical protein
LQQDNRGRRPVLGVDPAAPSPPLGCSGCLKTRRTAPSKSERPAVSFLPSPALQPITRVAAWFSFRYIPACTPTEDASPRGRGLRAKGTRP